MSLQTATQGWCIISKRNNLAFNIPYVGTLYIGMNRTNLNNMIRFGSKLGVRIERDRKNMHKVIYVSEFGEELFNVQIIGEAVHRIYCKDIASLVPPNMIYQVGKKMFITNNRVDGYMLAIKDANEIWLKEVKDVDAVDIDSASLGVSKSRLTKSKAQALIRSHSGVFDTKSTYAQDMYKKSQAEVTELENHYNDLVSRQNKLKSDKESIVNIIDKRKLLDNAQESEKTTKDEFDKAMSEYSALVKKRGTAISRLIDCGKLYINNNFVRLNRNSNKSRRIEKTREVPVYRTVTNTYTPDMLLHEDYEDYVSRSRSESTSSTQQVFQGYRTETYYETVSDKDFEQAERIARILQEPMEHCIETKKAYDKAKQKSIDAQKEIQEFMKTGTYKKSLSNLNAINKEINTLEKEIVSLRKQLYGN